MNIASRGFRAFGAALLSAAILATTLAPTAAQADRWRHGGYYGHRHHGGHGGAVAAGVGLGILGLAVGAAAANSSYDRECWYERRAYEDRYGDVVYRRIRVCR